tara:strand:- start:296 stop:751 length:456 start_codon:yes stop_codon:yes gene_type:complete
VAVKNVIVAQMSREELCSATGDNMPENGQVKTDVEILKRDMELLAGLAEKFDIAIDRLSDVSASVDKMLAVHETRLVQQEQQREIIHQRITDMKKEISDDFRALREENTKQHNEVSERLGRLEKWRWFVVGVATVIGFLFAQLKNISALFT